MRDRVVPRALENFIGGFLRNCADIFFATRLADVPDRAFALIVGTG
jgi:hypothetical protein